MRKMFMAYLLLFSQFVWAAENASQQQTEGQVNEEAVPETGLIPEETLADESNDPESGNEGDEQEAEEERQSSGRFIPTEQISQDLGVSFPVDI
jgi:hypothetical protein|tara:strand:- start:265 stop:546 length:282 start_codon:yes stop_codon:yes gene_type:complete